MNLERFGMPQMKTKVNALKLSSSDLYNNEEQFYHLKVK